MLDGWLIEILKGIGKLFINPLFYWIVILFLLTSHRRIKKERRQFGMKIYDLFSEGNHTLVLSLVSTVLLSGLAIVLGFVLSVEIIVILIIVAILLSITGSVSMLSASYTLGLTFILLFVLQFLNVDVFHRFIPLDHLSSTQFMTLALLIGLFLFIESLMLISYKNRDVFPTLRLSDRGIWIGEQQLKKLAFIPFFVLVPTTTLGGIAPIFPYVDLGNETFSLVLLPFIIGFHHPVRSDLPDKVAHRLGRATLYVSFLVTVIAISSVFVPVLSFVAVLVAILGKEWITYKERLNDKQSAPYFTPLDQGVKVLATIPGSPADRLGIKIGETVLKVNGIVVTNSGQLYEALQNSGAFFKLDIVDQKGEVRFISSAFYEKDHHQLGILFPELPYEKATKNMSEKVN